MDLSLQIQGDPNVRKRIQLEFLDHEAPGPGRGRPVDVAVSVRGLIVPNARSHGRRKLDPAALAGATRQYPGKAVGGDKVDGAGVDDYRRLALESPRSLKESERVSGCTHDIANGELASNLTDSSHGPGAARSGSKEHPLRNAQR